MHQKYTEQQKHTPFLAMFSTSTKLEKENIVNTKSPVNKIREYNAGYWESGKANGKTLVKFTKS